MWRSGVDRTTAKRVSNVPSGVKTHKDVEYLTVLSSDLDSSKSKDRLAWTSCVEYRSMLNMVK